MQAFMQHQKFFIASSSKTFYVNAMKCLDEANIPFLVGGAYAFTHYSGIERPNHDFDIFVKKEDAERILNALTSGLGCMGHKIYPHWLYKSFLGEDFIDIIFSSGNGVSEVDEEWFSRAQKAEILGHPARIIPAEEMIWSKAFIMERERFDGADVAHTIRKYGPKMNWDWLLQRFGAQHWRVLYSHLILAGYIYPSDKEVVPLWVMETLSAKLIEEQKQATAPAAAPPSADVEASKALSAAASRKLCHGTFLSRQQYLKDLCEWEYEDGRISLHMMSEQDVINWTAAGLKPSGAATS
eukprot:TRINITY_DN3165_c0_g1_i1.p1 TRINITY_DN3165_c0_g1~~TRINITY_DN3165_c0_g1_i1.p1  ORF type:complete len:297 (+),score=66.32 TRINITY_DN3165_c0_g1_i1:150-1040(+)